MQTSRKKYPLKIQKRQFFIYRLFDQVNGTSSDQTLYLNDEGVRLCEFLAKKIKKPFIYSEIKQTIAYARSYLQSALSLPKTNEYSHLVSQSVLTNQQLNQIALFIHDQIHENNHSFLNHFLCESWPPWGAMLSELPELKSRQEYYRDLYIYKSEKETPDEATNIDSKKTNKNWEQFMRYVSIKNSIFHEVTHRFIQLRKTQA